LSLDDGLDAKIITLAHYNDGVALRSIGLNYYLKIKDYSKAMAWYQLAANQNITDAYNNIGVLYFFGCGVSRDRFTAAEYFLKAARDNNRLSMINIASSFLSGFGVSVDKYKALEWFAKSGDKPDDVKVLNKQGIHLKEEDKSKSSYEFELCY
jgi:TPR repeat protein